MPFFLQKERASSSVANAIHFGHGSYRIEERTCTSLPSYEERTSDDFDSVQARWSQELLGLIKYPSTTTI